MSKLKNMSKDDLRNFCNEGFTDEAIGRMFGVSGVAIGYWRKKWGIQRFSRLTKISKVVLEKDYYSMTTEKFSKKYGVSKTVWLPYLRSLGIVSKLEKRVSSYPDLTPDQITVLIGSLLGDGGISNEGCYYETHCNRQNQYVNSKRLLLKPFSGNLGHDDEVFFRTVAHPVFKNLRKEFYHDDMDGKLIPLDFIARRWDDRILAYWFLDDGYFDDSTGCFSISNNCPHESQLRLFVEFLENKFGWGFSVVPTSGVYIIHMSNTCSLEMSELIKKVATPDMYYKIPEQYLTTDMAFSFLESPHKLYPKFYRLAGESKKRQMEEVLLERMKKSGFPYCCLSDQRKEYILDQFKKYPVSEKGGIISYNTAGMNLCESFFPNIYSARRKGRSSPLEDWKDEKPWENILDTIYLD